MGDVFLFVTELCGVKIKVCFSFFAVICLTCLVGSAESGKMLIMLACCCLHESGHIAAMLFCSCKPTELTLYGGGIRLTPPRRLTSFVQDAFVLSSGCAVNFILACASCIIIGKMNFFAQVNLLLGGFNLLPVGYLDGGKLLDLILGAEKAKIITSVFALLVITLAATAVFIGSMSVSLLCVLAYMCLSIFAA